MKLLYPAITIFSAALFLSQGAIASASCEQTWYYKHKCSRAALAAGQKYCDRLKSPTPQRDIQLCKTNYEKRLGICKSMESPNCTYS